MAETIYVERERTKKITAARYEFGKPLDDLLAVAREVDYRAAAVEVPDWKTLIVRIFDENDCCFYYEVENGHWLVHSEYADYLWSIDNEAFQREYVSAGGSAEGCDRG